MAGLSLHTRRQPSIEPVALAWLVRMRWGAVLGEALVVLVAQLWWRVDLPWLPLSFWIGLVALSNALLATRLRRADREGGLDAWAGGMILLDTAILTIMLYLSGGPTNPFSALYLVEITLAAVILEPLWIWTIVSASIAGYGSLFWRHRALGALSMHAFHADHSQGQGVHAHLYGMLLAFATAALLIACFVTSLAQALRMREAELRSAEARALRSERLASLTTLAAGAAHELSTPLGSIALVAKELERRCLRDEDASARSDARLIREEVQRCRTILDRMALQAGEALGENLEARELGELVHEFHESLAPASRERVDLYLESPRALASVPPRALGQVLENLVHNALDASASQQHVELHAHTQADVLHFRIRDYGQGMDNATLLRATEPFFTTKGPGKGMGLGLFLAASTVESLGGQLDIESSRTHGTEVRIALPRWPKEAEA